MKTPVVRPSSFVLRHLSFVLLLLAAMSATAEPKPADAAVLARFSPTNNFSTCPQPVRNAFKEALKSSLAAGDMATFGGLLDNLAKSGAVTPQTIDLWNAAASALAEDAVAISRRKPEEIKELVAGFRAEGTTFGLNSRPLGSVSRPALVASRLADAESVLLQRMPQGNLTPELLKRRNSALLAIQNRAGTAAGKAAALARLKDFALSAKPVSPADTNAVMAAVNEVFENLRNFGKWGDYLAFATEAQKRLAPIYGAGALNLRARALGALFRAGDMPAYKALAGEFAKLPRDRATLDALLVAKDVMTHGNDEQAWTAAADLLRRFVDARAGFPFDARLRLAEIPYRVAAAAGDIGAMRTLYAEFEAIRDESAAAREAELAREKAAREAKRPFTRDGPVAKPINIDALRNDYLKRLNELKAPADMVPVRRSMLNPRNAASYYDLGVACAAAGDSKGARDAFATVLTNASANAETRFRAAALDAVLASRDAKDFAKRVAALRTITDAEAAEGETRHDADIRFFDRLRDASRIIYMTWPDPAHRDYVDAIFKFTRSMEYPEEKVEYTAKFFESPPLTAEAAVEGGLFDRLPVENRMGRYALYSDIEASWASPQFKKGEHALLKSAPKAPHLAADVPGKEAGVIALYDQTGVHFYVRLNDPEAYKSRGGYADGVGVEFSVLTGENGNWLWDWVSSLRPHKSYNVEWVSPAFGQKLRADTLRVDAVSSDKYHAFHIFVPWLAAYDRIPGKGDEWRFVLYAKWAGVSGMLGGGRVHELGRGMRLRFDMSGAALDKVRAGLLRQAAGNYRSIRSEWENAEFWSDQHVGDTEFWEEVVKPYLAELDAAAKEVVGGNLDRAAVDRLSREHLADFADFRLCLDAKRAAWIRARLFAE